MGAAEAGVRQTLFSDHGDRVSSTWVTFPGDIPGGWKHGQEIMEWDSAGQGNPGEREWQSEPCSNKGEQIRLF